MAQRWMVLVAVVTLAACNLTLTTTNTNTSTGGNGGAGGSGGSGGTGSPTSPTPTPGTPTNGRTPDPPVGGTLPLPTYTADVVTTIPFTTASTCLSFGYLDAVVDALRSHDTRWGYACGSSGCGAVSLDKIAYHATAGAETTGVVGNWIVDIIRDVCGPTSGPSFSASYEANTGWSSRGRF